MKQLDRPVRVIELVAMLRTRAAFASALTDHVTAAARFQEAVDRLATHTPGRRRDETLIHCLVGLGNTLRLQGRYQDASEQLTAAHDLARRSRLDAPYRAATANALGLLAKDTGRYDAAAQHYATALAIMEIAENPDLALLATLHHNLAGLAHIQGNYRNGETPARQALELRRAAGASRTEIAADQAVLAAILIGQNRHHEAEPLLREAMAAWQSSYGPTHYEIAVNLNNIAVIEQTRGDLTSADQSLHLALAIKQRVLGSDHPEVAALLNNLGALQAARGQCLDAERSYDTASRIFHNTLGAHHPYTKTCQENLIGLVHTKSDAVAN